MKILKNSIIVLVSLIAVFYLYIFISPTVSDFFEINYVKNKCCEKTENNNTFYKDLSDKKIKWEDGIGFLKDGRIIFNPWELPTGGLIISEDTINATKDGVINASTIRFYESKCSIVAYNAEKNDPYYCGREKNEYCLKTDGEKLYIKALKEKEWSELKFKYLGEIPKDEHTYETEIAYYPCKKIKLECKYFSGIYEIHCER